MLRFIIFTLIVFCTHKSVARQSCDWTFRTSITITQTDFNGLSDYPVDLFLDGSNLHGQYQWSNNGNDLRIYSDDDITPLPFTINSWDAGSKGANVRVSFPNLDMGTRTIYVYYGNQSVNNLSTTVPFLPFVDGKIKFHTRSNNGVNPDSYIEAKSTFNQGNDNNTSYGCSHPNNFTGVTNQNQGTGRSRNNFIANARTLFTVLPGEEGNWGIRYGADFGYGGGLYVNQINVLDEKWTTDLWWAANWNSSDVLTGSVYLSAGEHELEIIGGEPGNDGGLTVQFSRDYSGPAEYSTATWVPLTSGNIGIRSEACPIRSLTISYGNHDVCTNNLSLTSTQNSSQTWLAGSSHMIDLTVNNLEISNSANSDTLLSITLPSDMTLTSHTGTHWNCTGTTGTISCIYNQDIAANNSANTLNITLLLDSGTPAGSTQNISAIVSGSAPDSDNSNNSVSASIYVLTNSGTPASCSNPQPGLLVKFFDTAGYSPVTISNAAAYQALVNARSTMNDLQGQTIFGDVNGSGNPFSSNDDYFLGVFEGYIYSANATRARFGVDGDDAIEAWVNGSVVSAYYGQHGPAGSAQDRSNRQDISQGFNPIEFRIQEVAGGDRYDFYWRPDGSSSYSAIPNSAFYHCAGDPNFQLNTVVTVLNDPINGTSFPKAIPFAEMTYTVDVQNLGNISNDVGSTVLIQALAGNTQLYVDNFGGAGSPIKFTDGSGTTASGVSYVFNSLSSTTDSISFSTDGTNFNTTPTSTNGYDATITHFKLTLPGTFKPTFNGITPTFNFEYQVQVQ
jgi:hypothetical protein